MYYWYAATPTSWMRCRKVGNILLLYTLEVILTGEQVTGRGRWIGKDAVIVEAQ